MLADQLEDLYDIGAKTLDLDFLRAILTDEALFNVVDVRILCPTKLYYSYNEVLHGNLFISACKLF